jgi:1-acyl-sn-glycerol-3-phosphate acyltransferase
VSSSGEITAPRAAPPDEPGGVVLAIYNVFYWPYLLGTCAILFFPALALWILTGWWDRPRRVLSWYTTLWASHYLAWAPFAGVRVEGREKVPAGRACMLVANHQSMVDVLAAAATRLNFRWVSKVENFYVPFLGWAMVLSRDVPLKRGYIPSIMRMVRRCNALLKEGHNLLVFPEGTRSPDGNLIAFYPGAFRLAVRNKVPVVPIVMEGTGKILPKGSFRIAPRPVLVRVLDPIDPASVDYDYKRLRDVVRARMAEELAKIRAR